MSEKPVIPRLLAGENRLSRVEKDAIFEQVVGGIAKPRRAWWGLGLAVPALAVPALAVIALVVWRVRPAAHTESEFSSRGASGSFAMLNVTCGACTGTDKLVFDVHGTAGYRYFAAFAQRTDGTVLWYFPETADATSLDLTTQPTTGILGEGVTLGSEHPSGTYRLFGVFSRVPLTRAALKNQFDPDGLFAGPDTKVVV
ncbi:hypothetical protein BH11MYX2_BH11MYX2_24650 [soil metagenome]